jgi:hypothetical protein
VLRKTVQVGGVSRDLDKDVLGEGGRFQPAP